MEQPLVSVVTPSLNQAEFIEQTIESVLAQTYPRIEHIVIDGGSGDGTLEILRRYDHLIWLSEPDEGQSQALNKGFARAQGPICGWLNSDDWYLPNAVEEGVEALRASGASLVYGDIERCDASGLNRRTIRARPWNYWEELNAGSGLYSPAAFFTRAALDAVGGFDESYHLAMDYDFWLRIGAQFAVRHVDAVWAVERNHPAAKTVAQREGFWVEDREISLRHGGRFVSPMLIRRHIRWPRAQFLAVRAAAAAYTVVGRRPQGPR